MWLYFTCLVLSVVWCVVCYFCFRRDRYKPVQTHFFTHQEIDREIVLNVEWGTEVPLKMMRDNLNCVCIISGFEWNRENVVVGNSSIYTGKVTLRPGRGISFFGDGSATPSIPPTLPSSGEVAGEFDASCSECQRTAGRGHAVNCSKYLSIPDIYAKAVGEVEDDEGFWSPLPPTPPDM